MGFSLFLFEKLYEIISLEPGLSYYFSKSADVHLPMIRNDKSLLFLINMFYKNYVASFLSGRSSSCLFKGFDNFTPGQHWKSCHAHLPRIGL